MLEFRGKKILVIGAHPDDETLGCGATISKFIDCGAQISALSITDGASARGKGSKPRVSEFKNACDVLGIKNTFSLDFPDNELDLISNLTITKEIESFSRKYKPDYIFTHFHGDLNIDHQRTVQAVMTAFRPQPDSSVRGIFQFEVVSATGWNGQNRSDQFCPNVFIEVTEYFDKKLEALKCYSGEMRDSPHSRSFENLRSLAKFRGATIGAPLAEAFELTRLIL